MNKLEIFNNQEFGSVRVFIENGEPWFVGKDICEVLKYKNHIDAIKKHVDEDDLSNRYPIVDSMGREQLATIINESGMYSLIIRSNMPEAKRFKKWVTGEVLPSIRKTGTYSAQQEPLSQAQFLLESAKMMVQFEKDIQVLQEQNRILESRVNIFDRLEVENDRQQLNVSVRKYSALKGCSYQQGWRDFRRYYNQSFGTNITTLKNNYSGGKKITMPEYLEKVGKLDDALRVVDKMIRKVS